MHKISLSAFAPMAERSGRGGGREILETYIFY